MDTMCNRCKKHVSLYHAILMSNKDKLPKDKLVFSKQKLQNMKTFCIACATRECKYYTNLPPSNFKNVQKEECERTLTRAERVKKYTIEEQLGKHSAMSPPIESKVKDLELPEGFDVTDIVELGEGAHGRVFYTLDNPNVIHKQQRDQRTCEEWSKEFSTHMVAYQGWEAFVTEGPEWAKDAGKFLRVTRPFNFSETKDSCEITIERVCTPGSEVLDHVMLGRADFNYFVKGMGNIKGYKQISDLLGINFEQSVKAMGVFAGFLQYGLEFSGKDLEFVYATPCGSDMPPRIYVLDFGDAVQKVDNVKVAEEGIGYIESYPLANTEFWENYLATAKFFGDKDMAKEVRKLLSEEKGEDSMSPRANKSSRMMMAEESLDQSPACMDNLMENKEEALQRIRKLHENRNARQDLAKGLPFGKLDPDFKEKHGMKPVDDLQLENLIDKNIMTCSYLVGINALEFRSSLRDMELYYKVSPDLYARMPSLMFQNGKEVVNWMKSKWISIFNGDFNNLLPSWIEILGQKDSPELLQSLEKGDPQWTELYNDMVFSLILQVMDMRINEKSAMAERLEAERLETKRREEAFRAEEEKRLAWESMTTEERIKTLTTDKKSFVSNEVPKQEITLQDLYGLSRDQLRAQFGFNMRAASAVRRILKE